MATSERFVDRTLYGIVSLIEDTVFSDEYARRAGLFQSLEPRVKVTTVFALVVAVSLLRHPEHILALYALTLALALSSRIPFGFFIKRVWIFVPLFSAAMALPAIFIVPGSVLLHIAKVGGYDLNVTVQGLESAVMFVLRVAASVSFVVLLPLTTQWPRLFGALRGIGVPSIFVLILGMAYRYVFYILDFVRESHLARRSRVIQPSGAGDGRRWAAGRIGHTLSRTLRIGDDVYGAMASRGFTGEAGLMRGEAPRTIDAAWIAFIAAAVCCLYLFGGFG